MTQTVKQIEMSTEERADLQKLAGRIRKHQERLGWSDSQLCRTYPKLGHTRTYKRCLSGATGELKGPRWLMAYRDVAGALDASLRGERVYDDLHPAESVALAVTDAMESGSIDRLVLVLGDSGSGKSSALAALGQRFGASRVVTVEARESWKEKPVAMLRAICTGLALETIPAGLDAMFDAIVDHSRSRQLCLCVDEAHHCGPRSLNVIKSLINQTRWEFVLAAYSSLWGKLSQAAYHEARQLTQNRLAAKIVLNTVNEEDVAKLLRRCAGVEGEDLGKAARLVAKHARSRGYLAFVRNVCREALREEAGEQPDYTAIEQAVRRLVEPT